MKKFLVLLGVILLFCGMLPSPVMAENVELNVSEFKCIDDSKMVISFSLVNYRGFDFPNVSLCFKILKDGNPIAGRELRVVVPKGSDGSRVYQTMIAVSCGQGDYGLSSTVFIDAKRYEIEEWFAGCPGSWKSSGNDQLK